MKKLISILLTVIMIMTMIPLSTVLTNAQELPKLELDKLVDITSDGDFGTIEYTFTPKTSDYYLLETYGDLDTVAYVCNSEWEFINEDDDGGSGFNFRLPAYLEKGKTYTYYVSLYDVEEVGTFQLLFTKMTQPVVCKLEVVKEPDVTQYYPGEIDYHGPDFTGIQVKGTFSDGSTMIWDYDEDPYADMGDWLFEYGGYEDDEIGRAFLYFKCGTAYLEYELDIKEFDVESIEVVEVPQYEIYENTSGYFYDDFYYYNYYNVLADSKIQVNFADGSSEIHRVDSFVAGYHIDFYDNQVETHWTVGENPVVVFLNDVQTTLNIEILPCPFKSVTVNSAPTRQYIFGEESFGYEDENGYYELYPYDLTGLSFTVTFNDNSTKTYTDADFDIDNWEIDGYQYDVESIYTDKTGTKQSTLYYKGAEITYDISIVESHIESIEVLKGPDKTTYEDIYYADYTGMEVKINYKDGTSAKATANDETLKYVYNVNDFHYQIKVGDDFVIIYETYDYESDKVISILSCAGEKAYYDQIVYTGSRYIDFIDFDNISVSGKDMEVTLTYEDGEEETLVLDVVGSFGSSDYTDGFAMTENGGLFFTVERLYDEFNVRAFGYSSYVPFTRGDADGDGEATVLDATAIQLHCAYKKMLGEGPCDVADVDGDGELTVLDATKIQLFIASRIDEL